MERAYETARETAVKIRKALKKEFPKTKFSVTSSTYSMGSSVTATYKDGEKPDFKKCSEVVSRFSSSSFDGMTDSSSLNGYEWEGKRIYGADYVRYQA